MPANSLKVDMVTDLKFYRTEAAVPLSFWGHVYLRQCKSVMYGYYSNHLVIDNIVLRSIRGN